LKRRGIKNVSGWEITEYAQAGILRGIMLYWQSRTKYGTERCQWVEKQRD
jgi:hypothetical protein